MNHRELIEAGQQEWMLANGTVMLWALMSVDQLQSALKVLNMRLAELEGYDAAQYPGQGELACEAVEAEAAMAEVEGEELDAAIDLMASYVEARQRSGYILSGPIEGLAEIRPPRGLFK